MQLSKFLLPLVLIISINIFSQKKPLICFSSDATKNDKQNIFIMDVNGDFVKQVAFHNLNCFSPRFSPDGKKIVFQATTKISDFIYMVDLDDTSSFRYPKFISGGVDPFFSPDGKYLLFRAERDEDNAIFMLDLQTDSTEIISDGSLSTHAEFSKDGNKVVYSSSLNGNFDLVVLDLNDNSDNAQKTIASTKDAELYGTFSYDGKLLAYASFDINYKGTVHVVGSDGKGDVSVSKGLGSSYNPEFSPDGKYLAFITNKSDSYQLMVCSPNGNGMKQMTSLSGNTLEFDWSPDSKKIVYDKQKDGVSSISVLDVESGKSENMTGEKANNLNPSFQR